MRETLELIKEVSEKFENTGNDISFDDLQIFLSKNEKVQDYSIYDDENIKQLDIELRTRILLITENKEYNDKLNYEIIY